MSLRAVFMMVLVCGFYGGSFVFLINKVFNAKS